MPTASLCLLAAAAACLVIAALHDAAFRTVPNRLAAILALCGIALHAIQGDLPAAILAAVIVFAGAAFCWRRGLMGGGDVKLLAAAALVAMPDQVPQMVAWTTLAGAVLTLPYLIGRLWPHAPAGARPRLLLARIARAERRRLRRGGPLPYAVAIAAGTGLTLIQGFAS